MTSDPKSPGIDRRTVLGGAALLAASGTVGPFLLPAAARGGPPGQAAWNALQRHIDGTVVQRGDHGYKAAHRLFNPRFDGDRPLAVVKCESAADVQTTIDFARKHNLKCRPKAGGHSYVGASTVQGGIVIDVSRIDQARYDAASKIATIGAGRQLYDTHQALARHGRTIPTGTCPTVGAAGLTLGGGLGIASRQFGLTCDQLEGLTIVSAAGKKLEVDAHHMADLFWASQGGGGGNFGIVTALRFHTQPTHRLGFFIVSFPWSNAPKVIRGWSHRVQHMKRSTWANLHLDAAGGTAKVHVVGACRAGDEDSEAQALERAVGVDASDVSTFQRSYLGGVRFLGGGTTSTRQVFAAGSDVVPHMSRDLARALAHLVERRAAHGKAVSAILDPLTGAVSDPHRAATAFPWRRHLCDIQWYIGLPNAASHQEIHASYRWIGRAHHAIARHADGSYINYLEPKRPVRAYYDGNLARLRQIKAQVDPDNFFHTPYTV